LFDGVQQYISRSSSAKSFLEKKKEIIEWLSKEQTKAVHTLEKVEQDHSESSRAVEYEQAGTAIKNNLHLIRKGMKHIDLPALQWEKDVIHITLDPALSPMQNAERFFQKSKKSKQMEEESRSRYILLKGRLVSLNQLLEEINEVESGISLKNFLHLQKELLHTLGYLTVKEQEELPPFKIFTVEGGFTVYAGKNSQNNDLLTVKYAKPDDLWFHARGSSGSHVVLKVGSASGSPSKKAIEQAAAIAAYYSKMKNAKHVPIAMTEKKYVRKPKGAPAGTVVIEREKVIFVQPKLPETSTMMKEKD
jgi:predicted ribosome quality control (RQC) complex YloA/Tae2 family protein